MADHDPDSHRYSLERVFPKLGETATSAEIIGCCRSARSAAAADSLTKYVRAHGARCGRAAAKHLTLGRPSAGTPQTTPLPGVPGRPGNPGDWAVGPAAQAAMFRAVDYPVLSI